MTSLYKLSLPIVNTEDDSFTKDLLHQFDKKRLKLHYELGLSSKKPSPEPSIIQQTTVEPIPLDYDVDEEQPSPSFNSKRSSSASELFRRSSVFFKSLLKKSNRPQSENLASRHIKTIDHQKKLLMKTTISIPSTAMHPPTTTPIPPMITQYPPKPLVYSPVEPIPQDKKTLLHRISMPLMRAYEQTTPSLSRHKSIASFISRRRKQ